MATKSINRSDVIKRLATQVNVDQKVAEHVVKIILERMGQSLANGERIEIRGFGSFELRYRAPRTARNPKTGEQVETKGHYTVHFKPGKELRHRVNTAD